MKSDILEGIIALLVALLILSIITEKAITLVRSYLKQFRLAAIAATAYLIIGLWFNSGLYPANVWLNIGIAFSLTIIFHAGLYANYSWGYPLYGFTGQKRQGVYAINGFYMVVAYVIAGAAITGISKTFLWWNALLFGLLLLLVQSFLHGDLFTAVTKGKVADKVTKEAEVNFFGVALGMLIAFFFKADFFKILQAALSTSTTVVKDGKTVAGNMDMSQVFSWNDKFPLIAGNGPLITFSDQFNLSLYEVLGIAVTGFFLSYGSHFFHDTLEYFIEVKNLTKVTRDKQSYSPESIEDMDAMIKTSRMAMADSIVTRYEKDLRKNHPNIKSIFAGKAIIDNEKTDAVIIHLKDNNTAGLEKTLPYKLPSGKILNFPVEVVTNVGLAKAHNKPGTNIANNSNVDKKGAFGCVVVHKESKKEYVLTCSHVAYSGSSADKGGIVNDSAETIRQYLVGKPPVELSKLIYYATIDAHNDTALLLPKTPVSNQAAKYKIEGSRPLHPVNDLLADVSFHGAISGYKTGKIHIVSDPDAASFRYDDDEIVKYTGLIVFGELNESTWSPITKKGDSGSVLVDDKNCAIGLIIGGNDRFSYALPISKILEMAGCAIV